MITHVRHAPPGAHCPSCAQLGQCAATAAASSLLSERTSASRSAALSPATQRRNDACAPAFVLKRAVTASCPALA